MMNTDPKKIEQLLTRGVESIIEFDHLKHRLLSGEKLRIKLGIDPTSPDLHLGNSISLLKLRGFQELGHQIILILGDFTAQIGDPSDKLERRPFLSKEQIGKNIKTYKSQIGKILNIKKIEWHKNGEWMNKFNLMEIIKLSNLMSVQQVLQRRNFKERIQKDEEITVRELYYPLLQGYDSVAVKADVEIGGNDQLFNLLVGRKIQEAYHQSPQDIMTLQMLEGLDGEKMSKTRKNIINILDTASEQFGKVMSMPDNLILKYFTLCTRLSEAEIKQILQSFANPRDQKARLAFEITKIYHGQAAAQKAQEEFDKVFKQKEMPTDIPSYELHATSYKLLDLLVKTELAGSKSEARRLIEQGAVKVNNEAIKDWQKQITITSGLIVQVGPRRFAKIE